jgi:metal-sulfur cluster biosynthetic enzyme
MSRSTEQRIWDALTHVHDPELEVDVVNLGLVYEVKVDGGRAELLMTLTSIGCPAQGLIEEQVRLHLGVVEEIEEVDLRWTFDPPWTPARITEEGRDFLVSMGYL